MTVFRDMIPEDLPALVLQASQIGQLGVFAPAHDRLHGAELVAAGPAWTAIDGEGRVLICAGFAEVFGQAQATAWAMLGGVGRAHVAVRRFMLARLAELPYRRIEAIVNAGIPAHSRWVELLGFERSALLRAWGPLSADHLLYERIR